MFDLQILRKMVEEQCTEAHLEVILQMIDALHDAAVVGDVKSVSPLDARTIIGWLDDIIFTAEETIRELQEARQETVPTPGGWTNN